jgi:hypothetical protein
VPFTPKNWVDWPSTSTPITAAALEDLETRVTDYAETQPGPAGATGATGATGAAGAAGADGKTVLYGTAAPTTEGVNGDFYIRTTTNFIYGPKAAGTWPSGTSLVGPTGSTGATGPTDVQQVESSAALDFTQASHVGKLVTLTGSTNRTFTIRLNATQAIDTGATIAVCQASTGALTVGVEGGVTLTSVKGTGAVTLRAAGSMASLVKTATNTWRAVGDFS